MNKTKLNSHQIGKSSNKSDERQIANKNFKNVIGSEFDHAFQTKIYDAFWKLSQLNASLRMEGIQMVCKSFTLNDAKNSDYILNRLVKGLGSNRKCSRLGFSCTLTELFNTHEDLKFEHVLDIVQKNFCFDLGDCSKSLFSQMSNGLTKEELRHIQIGLIFIYLAFIQSNRLEKKDDTTKMLIVSIAKNLNEIRKNKQVKLYVQELYLQSLIQLIKKVSNGKMFITCLLPVIERDLKELFQSTLLFSNSKHSLNLLLACINTYKNEMQQSFLKKNDFDLNVLFSHENYNSIYDMVSQSTHLLPNIQPFCLELFTYLIVQKPSVATEFWSHLIDLRLVTKKEHEKKYLSFKLFLIYLNYVSKTNYETIFENCLLLSDNLIQTLVNNYCNKKGVLNKICKDIMKEFVDILKVKEKEFFEFGKSCSKIIIKFTWFARNYHELSELFSTIVLTLNIYGLENLFEYFTNEFPRVNEAVRAKETAKLETSEKSPTDQLVTKYMWIANQLFNMSKNAELFKTDMLVQKILSFLLAYSYFNVSQLVSPSGAIFTNSAIIFNQDQQITIETNEKLQNFFNDILLKYVGIILLNNEINSNQKIINFITYAKNIMNFKELANGNKIELNSLMSSKMTEYQHLTNKIIVMLTNFNEKATSLNESRENKVKSQHESIVQTFFIITTLEFFRMFKSIKNSQATITDIEICYQEFSTECCNKNKLIKSSLEFNWIDVLVEMLLNILTINKNFIRTLVKNEFKKLFPILTFDSVKLIVDLLDIENEPLVEEINENEIESDNEEKLNYRNGYSKDSEDVEYRNSASGSYNEDEMEELEEMEQLDENLKINLEKINNINSEDEFDSDLDDEAMLKMDETYAKAFKQRKHEKSTFRFMIDYKLRVLDLIQELFKSNSRLDIVNYLIQPMLNILFESQKRANLKSISQRILGFLVNFKHCLNKINESKMPKIDDVFQTFHFIMECSTKHFNVTNTLLESSMFCVKILLNIANSSNEKDKSNIIDKLTGVYIEAIKCEKSKINPLMYKGFITRYPEHSIPIIIQIIDSASLCDVRVHKKIFALVTLSQTINNQMYSTKTSEELLDLVNKKIFDFINQSLKEIIKAEDLNIKYFDACLTLTSKALNLQKKFLNKESCENLSFNLNLFTKEVKVKQTYKSRINKLIYLCEQIFKNIFLNK